jgi:predicted regulator of Ras-like GTPase activity (Roadblock/LC7/MglB family)
VRLLSFVRKIRHAPPCRAHGDYPNLLPVNALRDLQNKNRSVQAAAFFDVDGALVASVDDGGSAPEVFASFVASLRTLAERTSTELGAGELETMLLDGKDGRLVVAEAGSRGYVAALVLRDAALGQALSDVRACARVIGSGVA